MIPSLLLGQIPNPQIRVCLQTQGHFESISIPGLNGEYGFCVYQSARLDSLGLISWVWERKSNLARDIFIANHAKKNCLQLGGQIILGEVLHTPESVQTLPICFFDDGSALDANSLELGPDSLINAQLLGVLKPYLSQPRLRNQIHIEKPKMHMMPITTK